MGRGVERVFFDHYFAPNTHIFSNYFVAFTWVVGPWQQHVTCLIVPPLEVGNKIKKPNNSIEAFVLEHVFLWPWLRDTILAPRLPHFWGLGMQILSPTFLPFEWYVQARKFQNNTYLPMDGSFPIGILLWMKPNWIQVGLYLGLG